MNFEELARLHSAIRESCGFHETKSKFKVRIEEDRVRQVGSDGFGPPYRT